MIFTLKTANHPVSLIRLYWKEKFPDDNLYAIRLYDKYIQLKARNQNPFPFLLEGLEKYPDAPDILQWTALEYERENEYLKALQTFTKLIELYPAVDHYRKEIEICKAWLESESMSETQETLDWLRQRMIEIWK